MGAAPPPPRWGWGWGWHPGGSRLQCLLWEVQKTRPSLLSQTSSQPSRRNGVCSGRTRLLPSG